MPFQNYTCLTSLWIMLVTLFRPLYKHHHHHHPHQSRLSASISIFLTSENGPMCEKCEMCIRQNLKFKYFFIKTSVIKNKLFRSYSVCLLRPKQFDPQLRQRIGLRSASAKCLFLLSWNDWFPLFHGFPFCVCVSFNTVYLYTGTYTYIAYSG